MCHQKSQTEHAKEKTLFFCENVWNHQSHKHSELQRNKDNRENLVKSYQMIRQLENRTNDNHSDNGNIRTVQRKTLLINTPYLYSLRKRSHSEWSVSTHLKIYVGEWTWTLHKVSDYNLLNTYCGYLGMQILFGKVCLTSWSQNLTLQGAVWSRVTDTDLAMRKMMRMDKRLQLFS